MILTAAGRLLVRHAERILAGVGALEQDITGHASGTLGRIDIGVFQSVSVKVLPTVVGRLRREADADVRPIEVNDDRLAYQMVETGRADASFVATQLPASDLFRYHELVSDPFVVVAPLDAPYGDVVTAAELSSIPLIGQPISDTCQLKVDAALLDFGVRPDYVFRTADNAALQSMVREGMGMAVMPLLAVDMNDPKIRVCRLEPDLPMRSIGLVTSSDPSPLVARFVELSLEVCREAVAAVSAATVLA